MAFQDWNGTCGMKSKHSGRNLAEKSGTNRDLKWDKNCSILFCFLNWYEMFRSFPMIRNRITKLGSKVVKVFMIEVGPWSYLHENSDRLHQLRRILIGCDKRSHRHDRDPLPILGVDGPHSIMVMTWVFQCFHIIQLST